MDTAQVDRVVGLIDWKDAVQYHRYVDCLKNHPTRIVAEAHRATDSWAGREAQRIPSKQLVHLINSAVDVGFSDDIGNAAALGRLLSHPELAVPKAVARWIEVSGDISDETARAVIEAHTESSGKIETLGEIRRTLGRSLAGVATDANSEITDRVAALNLATDAFREAAREAAFGLAADDDKELREAAADTLMRTPDQDGDEERLEASVERENVAPIEMKLKRALRGISMSTIEEAIERLILILDIGDEFTETPDASILLPDDRWHELVCPGFGGCCVTCVSRHGAGGFSA